jgi:hypothetical protein
MREHDLRAASTFFDCNKKFNTWKNPKNQCPYQIDHFLIPKHQLCHTTNVKRKLNSIDSDHAARCIKFQMSHEPLLQKKDGNSGKTKPRSKIDNFVLQSFQKHNFQGKVSDFLQNLDP